MDPKQLRKPDIQGPNVVGHNLRMKVENSNLKK